MHNRFLRAAAAVTAAVTAFGLIASGCDSTAMTREPVEGPPATAPAVTASASQESTASPVPTPSPAQTPSPTPVPTPEPTPASYKVQDTGPGVLELQKRLKELGYLDRPDEELTDYFGTETENAVRLFQRQNGLDVDGSAGPQTLGVLYSEDAKHCERLPLSGIKIGLDPGHQAHGNNEHEQVSPGSSETKPKVSSGTEGVSTHVSEYVVNLAVGLRLRDILQELGADVIMTRDTNDVNISNAERAQLMNDAQVDLVVRLHCDGEEDRSRNGAFILIPSGSSTSADLQETSRSAAEAVLAAFVAETGANNLGLSERSDQTGFNWSQVPVINIEMGHMSNPAEDERLVSEEYQQKCAQGIANGLVNFFT